METKTDMTLSQAPGEAMAAQEPEEKVLATPPVPQEDMPKDREPSPGASPQDPEPSPGVAPQEAQEAVRRRLQSRLGLASGDWAEIGAALEQKEADERQSEQERDMLRQISLRRRAQALREQLGAQAQALQSLYPDFDLKSQMQDPRFVSILQAGCSLQQAYEALNPAVMEKRLEQALASRAPRPREMASYPGQMARGSTTLADLNRQEREALSRRVLRGERIEIGHPN